MHFPNEGKKILLWANLLGGVS